MNKLSSPLFDRALWRCRRGMLELDLILIPFCNATFNQLSAEEQKDFMALLEEPDPDLYNWIFGYEAPPQQQYAPILAKIKAHAQINS